jgi:hypothetical protein
MGVVYEAFARESVPHKAFDGVVDAISYYVRRLPARLVDVLVPGFRPSGS